MIIRASNIELIFSEIQYLNIFGNQSFLDFYSENYDLNKINLSNLIIYGVSQLCNDFLCIRSTSHPIFLIQKAKYFLFDNVQIYSSKISGNFFEIIECFGSVVVTNSFFANNVIQGHFLDIIKASELYFKRVSCIDINQNPSLEEKLLMGGCFKTKNILSRNFEEIIIQNVFSGRTNVGIKIIDEEKEIEDLKNWKEITFVIQV